MSKSAAEEEVAGLAPHWVVAVMSRGHNPAPIEGKSGWRTLKKHASHERAYKEAARLANRNRSKRYAVYSYEGSIRVERGAPEADPEVAMGASEVASPMIESGVVP
jgi:hypothetical protein